MKSSFIFIAEQEWDAPKHRTNKLNTKGLEKMLTNHANSRLQNSSAL
jgi:hypothetical protein